MSQCSLTVAFLLQHQAQLDQIGSQNLTDSWLRDAASLRPLACKDHALRIKAGAHIFTNLASDIASGAGNHVQCHVPVMNIPTANLLSAQACLKHKRLHQIRETLPQAP